MISPRHIPALIMATGMTLGGTMPFFNPSAAIRTFGLPSHIASSPAAHSIMAIYGGRSVALGLAISTLYAQGQLSAVDTVMACVGVTGLVDGWVCMKEGVPGKAWFRVLSGLFLGAWGLLGMTAGRS